MKLEGNVALVTGAGQGIGEAIALEFAREGCDVAVNDLSADNANNVADKIKTLGRQSIAVSGDVTNSKFVNKMVKQVLDRFKRLNILVNNAGITKSLHILKMTEEIWDLSMNVNLKSAFLCSKAVAPAMIKQKNAHPEGTAKIINMSSKSGKQGGLWLTAYCASKFGVIGFTQSLALDLAPYKINVNAICPGIVFTPQWDRLQKEYGKKLGMSEDKVRDYYVKKIPLGREGAPEDVARVAVFLASGESDYMTGQAVNITGGQEMR